MVHAALLQAIERELYMFGGHVVNDSDRDYIPAP